MKTLGTAWHRVAAGVGALFVFSGVAMRSAEPTAAETRAALFVYDRAAGMALNEVGSKVEGGVRVRDLSFQAYPGSNDGRVAAYVVEPAVKATSSQPGIFWIHWLGEPPTTNRTEFLEEAKQLARSGVTSVLVDAMWAQPDWYMKRDLEQDYANSIRQVIALERGLDLLLSLDKVDRARVAVVAHDYGAMYGVLAVAMHGGVKALVVIAPTARFADWAFFGKKPASMEAYMAKNEPLELKTYLQTIRGVPSLAQFAGVDEYVPRAKADEFFNAMNEPKEMRWYPTAHHEMNSPETIRSERDSWLAQQLGIAPK